MVARLFETVRHRARRLRDAEAHAEGECAFLRTRHCKPRKRAERAGLNCGVQYFEVALPAPGSLRGAQRRSSRPRRSYAGPGEAEVGGSPQVLMQLRKGDRIAEQ